ncbi:hypothetical protein C8Q72DRAFT_959657 [Fomitopsis betulina]|nr:hypothetical protein C8Q72DRAFT_959657 [Fomitopsis betulina]
MLSDWESDLTDLSSDEDDVSPPKVKDEDEYVPSSIKKKARATTTTKDLGSDYKILNALRPPRTTQYTAKSLFDQIIENTIDLDPEYQRDVVWPDTKQSGLIDSILRNYYIPPVIFAVTAREDGSELRTCIDGKQRLTSIARKTNTRYWYTQNAGKGPRRKILPRQYQQAFANKQITCVEYETLSNDQEREIFQRVQLGVALTPAERLQALTGTRPTLVRQIQQKILGDNGFGSDLEWANGRGRDFQCLASIVYLIEQETDTFPGVSVLERWLTSINALPVKFEHNIMETFTIWVNLVRDKAYNMPFSKPTKVSPIEFTLIGLLIHKHKTSLSPMQLSNAIWAMRADVRKVHVDIRANTKEDQDARSRAIRLPCECDAQNQGNYQWDEDQHQAKTS